MTDCVRAFAPATVANVACGFDILGFAVSAPGDEVKAAISASPGVTITSITGDAGRLPRDPARNTAGVAVQALLKHLEAAAGIELAIEKRMPLGSGMGSSAASAVAALHAVNALLGSPLPREALLPFALEAERAACGAGHADNAAPSLLGGVVLVRSYEPLDIIKIPSPAGLFCTLIHPQIEIRTEDARRVLKKLVPLKSAVVQWANTAGLVAGLMLADFALIGRSLQDVIIEPERSLLIPGFDRVKAAALQAGALGCSISGSGPSLFALSASRKAAEDAAAAMQGAFAGIKIESGAYISPINQEGARILE